MKIALASAPFPKSVSNGLWHLEAMVNEAAAKDSEIICFPESYLPGYHGEGYATEKTTAGTMFSALEKVCAIARDYHIAVILPMDWYDAGAVQNAAVVISAGGEILGRQTKNQLDPTEDSIWVPGTTRHIFEVNGVKLGIVICHEGFRYPETVRWAARHDAKIVFHPQCTGSDVAGATLVEWGHKNNPYYEKAMMMRALENTIYFASVNYAFRFPDSGSAVINPDGSCLACETYGKQGVLVTEIDPSKATGLLAKRLNTAHYS